uniref:Eco57I restriction-modification methylase domain-containing protein n=1 Tax=Gelidibacter sp. TaxID=2018083 RepID=UPI00404A2BF3
MALYQTSVLKNYLNLQDAVSVEKSFKKYKKYFYNTTIQENIKKSKEEEYQGIFLTELFVNVLGYTLNPMPNFNLVAEKKNETNAQKADGAILKNNGVIAVIELKGSNTKDLESIRKQAFDYKANQKGCEYIITSNFEKLRFYINDATEYEEFNLFTLTENEFALLYICLSKESLINGIPLKIMEESVIEEEKITKQFYSDYSIFKRELFRDLVKRNTKHLKQNNVTSSDSASAELYRDKSPIELSQVIDDQKALEKNTKQSLFKKSQKLIDRFLFIFFAEDRNLLPANSVHQILQKWEKDKDWGDEKSLYTIFKQYFNFLDTGRKETSSRAEIFAYNGGLFKPDAILDSIEIDDNLLFKHVKKLATYDFESQVDVNILGHIFENSLNEIESVNAEIDGGEFDKQKSKRKKDGVFYTPKYITKYIVENTVGKLCTEKKEELGFKEEEYYKSRKGRQQVTLENLVKILDDYRKWLLQLTICDPACGSGAFLNQALDFLIKEHKYIDELKAKLLGGGLVLSDIENTILENNIYGVDLNEESVEIAKLSLWLRTAQPRRKLNDLSNNIKCGNSLIDSKAVAGNKAFNWQTEFPQIFNPKSNKDCHPELVEGSHPKKGFDVVIGNPPYVRAELLTNYLGYFEKNFNVYHSASDLFAYFYELGSKIINKKGLMGYISNTFDKTTAGKVLRDYLTMRTNLKQYIDFTEVQIFDGATTYPIIIILQNYIDDNSMFKYVKIPKSSQNRVIDIDIENKIGVLQNSLDSSSWSFSSIEKSKILNKISQFPNLRKVYGKCYYGVKTALNDAFIVNNTWTYSEHIKPILEGKDIKKWNVQKAQQKLILFKSKWTNEVYPEKSTEEDKLNALLRDFPEIFNHLLLYKERAIKRYDKGDYWWELRNCAYYDLFDKPKIIFPNLQNSNKFCFDRQGTFVNAPAVFLPVNSETLLCILNSKIVWEFLKSICVVRSGGYIEVKPQYFEQIPIPELENEVEFETNAKMVIALVNELQNLDGRFQDYISSQFVIEKLTRKLENWHELSFSDFTKELNKAIKKTGGVPLTKKDEFDWLELFEEKNCKHPKIAT